MKLDGYAKVIPLVVPRRLFRCGPFVLYYVFVLSTLILYFGSEAIFYISDHLVSTYTSVPILSCLFGILGFLDPSYCVNADFDVQDKVQNITPKKVERNRAKFGFHVSQWNPDAFFIKLV